MSRLKFAHLYLILVAFPIVPATLWLSGCGGDGPGGAGGGNPAPAFSPIDTARFDVNLTTGKVTITQSHGTGDVNTAAVWTGTGVQFNSSEVLFQAGNPGRRYFRVSITNKMPETIGSAAHGLRVVITGFSGVVGGTGEPIQISDPDGVLPHPMFDWANRGSMGPPLPYYLYPGTLAQNATTAPKAWWFTVPSGITAFSFATSLEADPEGPAALASVTNANAGSTSVSVRTILGSNVAGYRDGAAVAALLDGCKGLALDAAGNLYLTETGNRTVRRMTPNGVVSTLAGNPADPSGTTDGPGYAARFIYPHGIAVTADGSLIFVAEWGGHTIRLLKRNVSGTYDVSTIAGLAGTSGYAEGPGGTARFNAPYGLAFDETAMTLYVTEWSGNRIRALRCVNPAAATAPAGWYSRLVAGSTTGASGSADGTGAGASFNQPAGIALAQGGTMYVCDRSNHRIRRVTTAGQVSTFAGSTSGYHDATGTAAQFNLPNGIAVDSGGWMYVVGESSRIRRISPMAVVSMVAGTNNSGSADGTGAVGQFWSPTACAMDAQGNLYISDGSGPCRIRLLQPILNVAAPPPA